MKHAVHQHFVIGCVLALVGGVIVWTLFVCNTFACIPADTDRPGRGGDNLTGRGSDQTELANQSGFEITGSPTKRMSPGVHVPLDLRLQNSNKTSMSVQDLVVTVRRVDAPRASVKLPCLHRKDSPTTLHALKQQKVSRRDRLAVSTGALCSATARRS